jgi:hypothetical protein
VASGIDDIIVQTQANEADAPVRTDALGHYREAERRSCESAESSRDMHTEALVEDCALIRLLSTSVTSAPGVFKPQMSCFK